jgi:hypothetical protein
MEIFNSLRNFLAIVAAGADADSGNFHFIAQNTLLNTSFLVWFM